MRSFEGINYDLLIVEQKAPTATDIVRLLRELELEAKAAVVSAVRVQDCPIDVVLHETYDALSDRKLFRIIYSVNGKRNIVNAEAYPEQDFREIVFKALAEDIAANLLSTAKIVQV